MTEEDEFCELMSENKRLKRHVWIATIILAALFWVCVGVVAWKVLS